MTKSLKIFEKFEKKYFEKVIRIWKELGLVWTYLDLFVDKKMFKNVCEAWCHPVKLVFRNINFRNIDGNPRGSRGSWKRQCILVSSALWTKFAEPVIVKFASLEPRSDTAVQV